MTNRIIHYTVLVTIHVSIEHCKEHRMHGTHVAVLSTVRLHSTVWLQI